MNSVLVDLKGSFPTCFLCVCSELFGNVPTGINFEKYDNIPVEATGETCPPNVSTFEECNFSEIIQENIKVWCDGC